jgi:hypothetical protein
MVVVEVADEVTRHRRFDRRHRQTPQEDAMSATTIPASRAPAALNHGLRIALVAAAIVVLLTLAFVAGRATRTEAGSTPAVTPTTTPATTPATGAATTNASPAGASVTPKSCHMVPDC